jgi:MoaA/NifB/PqqE/SkfB family radical SAM enzyme
MNKFYGIIKELHIENTSICNAACPMCLRESTPDDKSWFKEDYISCNFFDTKIPNTVYENLEHVMFNGVIGDPCAAPNFVELVKLFKTRSPQAKITVSTNGGLRNETFWQHLATALTINDIVTFAIDGLEDTNHIYRINVEWTNVMRNAKAFINAGGNAHWQFISFQHNEHQIESARKLASTVGFSNFYVKPSHRFILDDIQGIKRYGANGELIAPPTKDNQHPLMRVAKPKVNINEWLEKTNDSKINCYAKHNGSVYIDYAKRLFPCCPISSGLMARRNLTVNDGWDDLWQQHGGDKISLEHDDWDSIISGRFFQEVEERWTKDYASGRLASCVGACSDSNLKFNDKNA